MKQTRVVSSLKKPLDTATLSKLSEQRVERYMKLVARTRRNVAEHFQDHLKIPADPCLDILLALQTSDDRSLRLETIAEQILRDVLLTRRYLNVMAAQGLIDFDEQSESAFLTSLGVIELAYIIEQTYTDYLQVVE